MIETEYVFQQDTKDHPQEPQKPGNQVKNAHYRTAYFENIQKVAR